MIGLIIVFAIIGAVLQGIFISREYVKAYVAADILKGAASLMFVAIGIVGVCSVSGDTFAVKILIGLIFGMIGDIVMNLRFVFGADRGQKAFLAGILAFLIGHVLYLTALVPRAPHAALSAVIGAVITGALLAYIFKTMEVKIAFKIFGIFYLGAVIIMTVMALDAAVFTGEPQAVVYAVGAVLFAASDIVLIFNTFGTTSLFSRRILNLTLYYIGQLLIAGCLLLA